MNIVADHNIPGLEQLLGHLGEITALDGRSISRRDLLTADALLVRSVSRVDEVLLKDTPVRFVASATAGHDHIDMEYLKSTGRHFALASGSNAQSVVEYVFAALAETGATLDALCEGHSSLGVIGYGNVGQRLVSVARTLGISVLVYDPYIKQCPVSASFEQVMRCDVVSLHCALSQEGRFPSWHLLNRQVLTTLRPEQVLINAARGGIIDETALLERASRGGPSLIVDCWEGEPCISEALIEQASLATPHVAGYSKDGKWRGTQMLGEALTSFLRLEGGNAGIGLPSVSVQLGEHHSMAQTVRLLLGQVYDITTDDALLRRALRDSGGVERGRQFDRLRRDYRERRELFGAQLHCDAPSEWIACVAKAFQLERKDS